MQCHGCRQGRASCVRTDSRFPPHQAVRMVRSFGREASPPCLRSGRSRSCSGTASPRPRHRPASCMPPCRIPAPRCRTEKGNGVCASAAVAMSSATTRGTKKRAIIVSHTQLLAPRYITSPNSEFAQASRAIATVSSITSIACSRSPSRRRRLSHSLWRLWPQSLPSNERPRTRACLLSPPQ